MTRRPLRNPSASVHDRLLARAKTEDRPFEELLLLYGIERFLHRLSRSSHARRFVLKGALMLPLWSGPSSRPTRDVDLAAVGRTTTEAVEAAIRACLTPTEEGDGLRFDPRSLRGEEIRTGTRYRGARFVFLAWLGKSPLRMQVDVGFGDAIVPPPREIHYPTLLGSEAPLILSVPPETAVAEKVHAMVLLDVANTRLKDFHDVWHLAVHRMFRGEDMVRSLGATFSRRGTPIPENTPAAFTESFPEVPGKEAQWRAFLRRSRIPEAPGGLAAVVKTLASFVLPTLEAARDGNSGPGRWPPGGPWSDPG